MPHPLMDGRVVKWNDKVPDSNRPSKMLALSNKLPANIESRIQGEKERESERQRFVIDRHSDDHLMARSTFGLKRTFNPEPNWPCATKLPSRRFATPWSKFTNALSIYSPSNIIIMQ
ncbi:hypothetical protein T07_8408 [Trichinella nelsoni]|uniref:Uncharacterized protein n=1 Tax=Trichinella nelsoni TaxID=6336 RepID=A0A0V0S8I4_9BILA|nr:hypothetical protein T07_8408 [Trichinella nelsoni]